MSTALLSVANQFSAFVASDASGENPYGKIYNPQGCPTVVDHYEDGLFAPKAIYIATMHPDNPLFFRTNDGQDVRPDFRFYTDWGSIPPCLQWRFPKDECLGYLLHDFAYKNGGLYFRSSSLCDQFRFRKMTRLEIDRLLRMMYLSQWWERPELNETYRRKANVIYAAVRCASWIPWMRYRSR